MSKHNWSQPVTNESSKLCNNAEEFFGGPFFDADGELTTLSHVEIWHSDHVQNNFRHSDLIPLRSLADTAPFLEEEDPEAFLSFVRQMLTWLPEKRKTARELMDHPFLKPVV
jgi:serine/threonine protein kinase